MLPFAVGGLVTCPSSWRACSSWFESFDLQIIWVFRWNGLFFEIGNGSRCSSLWCLWWQLELTCSGCLGIEPRTASGLSFWEKVCWQVLISAGLDWVRNSWTQQNFCFWHALVSHLDLWTPGIEIRVKDHSWASVASSHDLGCHQKGWNWLYVVAD